MRSAAVIVSLALIGAAAAQTAGCGKSNAAPSGKTTDVKIAVGSDSRMYGLHIPKGYDPSAPSPVVFAFHGWGGTAAGDESYLGLSKTSDDFGFIAVYPQGWGDYNKAGSPPGRWGSWNAVGSTETLGDECTKSTEGYCYRSCAARPQGCGRCDWTTCLDDDLFVETILDYIESNYCVDLERVHATGFSNGGMMSYEIGLKLSSRFASIAPGGGQPFVGHNNPPDVANNGYISVMDMHGKSDTTCPANTTTSADGWKYTPVDQVMVVWAKANGCANPTATKHYPTEEDGLQSLYCVSFGECPDGVDVVRCSYDATHNWPGCDTPGGLGARLAWWFLDSHPKLQTAGSAARLATRRNNSTLPAYIA